VIKQLRKRYHIHARTEDARATKTRACGSSSFGLNNPSFFFSLLRGFCRLGFRVGFSHQLGEKQNPNVFFLETDENDVQIHAREFYIRGEKTTVDDSSGSYDRRFQSVSRGKGGGGGEKEMEVVLGRGFWRPKSSNSDDDEEGKEEPREREQL